MKWLVEVRALTRPFTGHFQSEQYVLAATSGAPPTPVTTVPVNSVIVAPTPGSLVRADSPVLIHGQAWLGTAAVARVDVSVDGGRHWRPAALEPATGRYEFAGWTLVWTPTRPGHFRLCSRASDHGGGMQPMCPPRSRLGYGNNAVVPTALEVTA